jgi:hypothetical protein
VFITALNLLPVGQLDGGHVAYAMFGGRHAKAVSVVVVVLMVGLGLFVWPGLLTWALIVSLLAAFSHMPALDGITPPDAKRFGARHADAGASDPDHDADSSRGGPSDDGSRPRLPRRREGARVVMSIGPSVLVSVLPAF